jgi:HEAT repeat protein
MNELRKTGLVLGLAIAIFSFAGFGPRRAAAPAARGTEALTRHIAQLKSGTSQDKAAAAYWLGQQKAAATPAIDPLVSLLGDASEVNPAQYRSRTILQKMTVGEEAAAALVNIGHSAIEPLIRVLKTSPEPEARKNAAWALGALHDTGATQI